MRYSCFISTNKGLEEVLKNEVESFGITSVEILKSGVKCFASFTQIMELNLKSRIASRIMLEIGQGTYNHENDIYDIAYAINWPEWFNHNLNIKVKTVAIASPVKSLNFINLKVKDAICDKFVATTELRPNVDRNNPDVRIYTFLNKDQVTIYLDTSGESLFKRGYRKNKLEAPLKENLAAGIIALAAWDYTTTFYDPMCGSGTLAIEAAMLGLNIAPGLERNFAFEKLKIYDSKSWISLKSKAKNEIKWERQLNIYASDIDNNALKIAGENAKNANVLDYIKFKRANFLEVEAPANTGTIVTNPPYGVRLTDKDDLAQNYPLYASHLKKCYANWDCYFITADLELPKLMRLKPNRKTPLYNGALECRLFQFKMVMGSNR